MDAQAHSVWRPAAGARVATGAAVAFAAGLLFAAARGAGALGAARVGACCGALAAPFFALREVVAAGVGVDGPVASAIAGGFAGYFGALFIVGPRWQAVSQGAMAVGLGSGLADAVISALDWKRKVFLVNRADAAAAAAAAALAHRNDPRLDDPSSQASAASQGARILRRDESKLQSSKLARSSDGILASQGTLRPDTKDCAEQSSSIWFKWPSFFTMRDVDGEYHDLIRRREATILALEEEQARIAQLLEALESVKASNRAQPDAELGESSTSTVVRNSKPPISPRSVRA